MQDPQSYEDDAGNVYVRDGNRWRVIRGGQSAAPAGPMPAVPGLIQMETPQQRQQAEERVYDRQRDAERDERLDRTEGRAIEAATRAATAAERQAETLTAEQGKSLLYGRMMSGAEADYQRARAEGYNPASGRNTFANLLDGIPFDRGFVPALIRDDQSDAGYQAERRWAEANLRQITGAAAAADEITRVQGINFDRANDELSDQRYRTRRDTYGDTRVAAGPARERLPEQYPGQYGAGPVDQNGPPTYPSIDRILAQGSAAGGPQPGEVHVSQQPLAPTDSPNSLSAAGYVYDSARDIWTRSSQQQIGSNAAAAPAPGESDGYQTALAQERANADLVAKAGGGVNMATEFTGPLNDEMAYAAGWLGQGIGNIGRRLSGQDIEVTAGQRGAASRDVMRQDQDRFAREHPVQNVAANVLGGAAFGPGGAARTLVGRMAQGAGIGAGYGFAAADGSVTERLPSTAIGAVAGAVAAPAVERIAAPVLNALAQPVVGAVRSGVRAGARGAGHVGNALNIPGSQRVIDANALNPLESGMNRFADRMGPARVNALNPAVAERQAAGISDPTLISVLDDGSIGRVRALGTRDTPARDVAVRSSEARTRNLPSRTARIAREEISQETRPALEIIDAQKDIRRANASAIDGFGADPVPVDANLSAALQSDLARGALRAAAGRASGSLDPAERAAAERLAALAEGRASATGLTVREAQDISKALNDAATSAFRNNPADGAVLRDLGKGIRDSARTNSEGYRNWLRQYGEDSDLIEAATTGRNFVSVSGDPVNARGTEAFVRRAGEAGDAELAIQRAASREAVEAVASNPSGARTVLGGFANDVDQARRATAIGVDAGRLQTRAAAELDDVTRHQRASPRVGSETSTNAQDAGDTAGMVMQTAANPLRAGASWVINRVASRGFSNAEAEAIVIAANNPAQTQELIGMLARRMSRRDARNLARAIRYQLATNPQSGQQSQP